METKALEQFIEFNNDKFTKRVIYNVDNSTVFVLNFQPSQALPKHKHPGSNVYIHMLTGTGSVTVDGHSTAVKEGDLIFVNGDEEFSFVNDGDSNVSLYVMLNKTPNEQYSKDI